MPSVAGSPTDGEVIAASLEDREQFAVIFDRHYVAVFRYAERRVGAEAAREVASEVFMSAFRLRGEFAGDAALPWLLGIASRRVLHEHRRFARHTAAMSKLAAREPGASDEFARADRRLDASDAIEALRTALDTLDPESRELVLLAAWERLTYAEIAAALRMPIGTVRSRLHRARRALAAQLGTAEDEWEEVQ
jgi:RNA polymerase sigma-70 factor (ECF subfamily)